MVNGRAWDLSQNLGSTALSNNHTASLTLILRVLLSDRYTVPRAHETFRGPQKKFFFSQKCFNFISFKSEDNMNIIITL